MQSVGLAFLFICAFVMFVMCGWFIQGTMRYEFNTIAMSSVRKSLTTSIGVVLYCLAIETIGVVGPLKIFYLIVKYSPIGKFLIGLLDSNVDRFLFIGVLVLMILIAFVKDQFTDFSKEIDAAYSANEARIIPRHIIVFILYMIMVLWASIHVCVDILDLTSL